jgi:hypothetical protein
MVDPSRATGLPSSKRDREQKREEIRRSIDRNINEMHETSVQTRELIADTRRAIRRADQAFKRR